MNHHHADYSAERRAHALRWIHGEGLLTDSSLTEGARIVAVVGLICDSIGRTTKPALVSAMRDPAVLAEADSILAEARAASGQR